MEDQALPQLLSATEVAELLRIKPWRVYERIRAGDLPAVRIGRTVRVSASALRDWIEHGGTGQGSYDLAE